jgi:hypothetical protein
MEASTNVTCGICRTVAPYNEETGWSTTHLRCGDSAQICGQCNRRDEPSSQYHICYTSSRMEPILAQCCLCGAREAPPDTHTRRERETTSITTSEEMTPTVPTQYESQWVRNCQNYWYCVPCFLGTRASHASHVQSPNV